jgi:hypothetical protein
MATRVRGRSVEDGTIGTADLADGAVTFHKLADGAVDVNKIAGNAVQTAQIADTMVTAAKLANSLDLSGKTITLPAENQSRVVQVVHARFGASATGTTTVPLDDTIPQITEGTEFMTAAITPTSATNKLRIDVVFIGSTSAVAILIAALFQDAGANALAVAADRLEATSTQTTIGFTHYMDAGTTEATTFRVRAGGSAASTVTFNGGGGSRRFGGVMASSITITEIRA